MLCDTLNFMIEKTELAEDFQICRILNGMWQVAGTHGQINPNTAISEMINYYNAGFTTWDLADIYGPAESFVGKFTIQLVTAWCPT